MKTVGGTQKTVSYYRKVENNCNYRLNQITSVSFWIFWRKNWPLLLKKSVDLNRHLPLSRSESVSPMSPGTTVSTRNNKTILSIDRFFERKVFCTE